MRRIAMTATLALLVATVSAMSWAQEPVRSFDQLNTQLKVGDTVWVTPTQGGEIKGKIRELQPFTLTLDAGVPTTLAASNIRRVRVRKNDGVLDGLLYGLAGGGAACALAEVNVQNHDEGALMAGIFCAIAIPAGAGIGILTDAMIHGKRDIFVSDATPTGRLLLGPMITPDAKGIAVSWVF